MKKIILLAFLVTLLSACNLQKVLPFSGGGSSSIKSSSINLKKETIVISALNSKKIRQKKHGVSISIEAVNVVPELWYEISLEEKTTFFIMNGQLSYIERRRPYYKNSAPLAFRIKISNNSNRVFRPKNAIFTFNIDGESASVDPKKYKKLANSIIVPNSSASFTVYGPNSSNIQKKKGTIHLGMYDVTTGESMSNFEWYFKYKTKSKSVSHKAKQLNVKLTEYEASRRDGNRYKAK